MAGIALVVNGGSRRGEELFEHAKAICERSSQALEFSLLALSARQFDEATEEAVRRSPKVLIGGGDGSLSLVARHFVQSRATLGVLPLGTGNAFARDIGVPVDVEGACAIALNGNPTSVDLGFANGDYFVNVATTGLTSQIVRQLDSDVKRRFGKAAYLAALARALQRVKPFRAKLQADDTALEFETLQVVVGNGRYHAGPFAIAPDASLTDGKLSIYGLATTNRASLFRLGWHLMRGSHCELPEVHAVSAREGRLITEPPQPVVVDGEIARRTPLTVRVEPAVLSVMAPVAFARGA